MSSRGKKLVDLALKGENVIRTLYKDSNSDTFSNCTEEVVTVLPLNSVSAENIIHAELLVCDNTIDVISIHDNTGKDLEHAIIVNQASASSKGETEEYFLENIREGDQGSFIDNNNINTKQSNFKSKDKTDEIVNNLESGDSSNLDQEKPRKRTRSKRQHVNENTWDVKRQKLNREKGKKYMGRKNVEGKCTYENEKKPRELKLRCKCTLAKKTMKCASFSEETRQKIFLEFWSRTWEEKKLYVQLLTEINSTARERDRKNEYSRRSCSMTYYLKKGDERLRVCKTFFINTLDIGEWSVRIWKKEEKLACSNDVKNATSSKSQSREKLFADRKSSLLHFFKSLVKVESHYCRASSKKLYLEPTWKSKSKLYDFYVKDWCQLNNEKPLSIGAFSNEFENENLSLFSPKKDLCDVCVSHQTKNLSDAEFFIHKQKKEEARHEKMKDKENEQYVYTMDLQSVLLSPKSNVSSMYYKTKLAVHNFTLYDLKNKDGFCYIWNETEGNLTAQEFSTIIGNFILSLLPLKDSDQIILYSDGCGYQNRNVTLSNTLLNISMTENITIVQKFLEKGHTQMEVDSMHSTIERVLRDTNINIPADYIGLCERARKMQKYKVSYLEHPYFKNIKSIQFFNSIRPGKKVGDPVVTDIRALRYTSDGKISYKLRFTEEWSSLALRKNANICARQFDTLPQLHTARIKIKKSKFDHLQALKNTLPQDYHQFYDNIPYYV